MSNDWLPNRRDEILGMAMKWNNVLVVKGAAWNVPEAKCTELNTLTLTAQAAFNEAMTKDRTTVLTAKVNAAFKALSDAMRDIKKRYYYIPPLTEIDMASLDLTPPDTIPTPVSDPAGQVTAAVMLLGSHLLKLIIEHVEGTPLDPKADYGSRIYWGIMPHGGGTLEQAAGIHHYLQKPPVSGNELPNSLFTRRKREQFDFPAETSGMTVYFCIRYENSKGKSGPWGPIFQTIIP